MRSAFFASLLAAVLALGVGAAGATPVTFADPAGDAGNAPDLTSVVVDNDAGGKISIVISWANAAYLNEDSYILVYFNSDRNAATGNAGSDYLLRIRGSDYTFDYLRWNGSDWVDPPSPITVTVDQNALQTFEVAESERAQQLDHRLADRVDAPHRDGGEVVARPVPAGEVEVDQVDRGHAFLAERVVVVLDCAARSGPGRWNRRRRGRPPGAGAPRAPCPRTPRGG